MRIFVLMIFALLSVSLLSASNSSIAFAQDSCRCKGCGCKGGSGWRGPDGFCVPSAKLASICGTPAGTPCTHEAAPRVCFAKQSALTDTARRATP